VLVLISHERIIIKIASQTSPIQLDTLFVEQNKTRVALVQLSQIGKDSTFAQNEHFDLNAVLGELAQIDFGISIG
jgi:hypothetical protein